ncbi:MAG TPA: glycosyltransferase [Opitutus sp.]|nr:glycosyltransferase [Opitutus sp.]
MTSASFSPLPGRLVPHAAGSALSTAPTAGAWAARPQFSAAHFLSSGAGNYARSEDPDAPRPQLSRAVADTLTAVKTSVLVNTCNHGRYIEECIESLLVQTVLPDEIIVYDDCSRDDTVERLRRYGDRIRLIEGQSKASHPHICQANAVQTAYQQCRGNLVFLLDGDDRFKRRKIEHYVSVFKNNSDAALIQSPMDKIDQHGRLIGTNVEPRKHVVEHLKEIYRRQDVDFFYPTSALAFSRTYLDCVLPLDFSDGMDLWMDTRLSIIAPYFGRVITLPQRLTEWRRHQGSDSLRVRSRRLQIEQTLMRTRVFNDFCRRYGLRTISAWRNRRFYLQLLRYSLPETAYHLFHERFRSRTAHQA